MKTANHFKKRIQPITLFFSYSHKDEELRDKLETHLSFLKRSYDIQTWYDRKIGPGDNWRGKISKKLDASDIILLLISPDFGESDYCYDVEAKRALELYDKGETHVIPVIMRETSGWRETPMGRLQALPKDGIPVTSPKWNNIDEALKNIADGIRKLLKERQETFHFFKPKELIHWKIIGEGKLKDFDDKSITEIELKLRQKTSDDSINIYKISEGSVELFFKSKEIGYEAVKNLHNFDELSSLLDFDVIDVKKEIGAVIRFETKIIDKDIKTEIKYLPDFFGENNLEKKIPPLVGAISFPLDNPIQIGFSLYVDDSREPMSKSEQIEVQTRLGKYLNTFLVLSGEHINVSLSPYDEYCGLPELLRHTELGRDMLAQDVILKHYAACLLHPLQDVGSKFWSEIESFCSNESLESCFRVWILPGEATVNEKTKNGRGYVEIKKLNLRVLCEYDYEILKKLRNKRDSRSQLSNLPIDKAERLFKYLVLPKISDEVNLGSRFGILRQILSVMIMANWIRQSKFGEYLTKAGFIDSNDPEKYKLNTVGDEPLIIRDQYIDLFENGVWQHTKTYYNFEKKERTKRLYIAGGVFNNEV